MHEQCLETVFSVLMEGNQVSLQECESIVVLRVLQL